MLSWSKHLSHPVGGGGGTVRRMLRTASAQKKLEMLRQAQHDTRGEVVLNERTALRRVAFLEGITDDFPSFPDREFKTRPVPNPGPREAWATLGSRPGEHDVRGARRWDMLGASVAQFGEVDPLK